MTALKYIAFIIAFNVVAPIVIAAFYIAACAALYVYLTILTVLGA